MLTSFRNTIAACTTLLLLFNSCTPEKEKVPPSPAPGAEAPQAPDHGSVDFDGCLPANICDLIGRDNCNLAVVARSKSSNKIVAKAYISSRDTCWLKPNGCEAKGSFGSLPVDSYTLSLENHDREYRASAGMQGTMQTLGYLGGPLDSIGRGGIVRDREQAAQIVVDAAHLKHTVEFRTR